MLIRTLDLGLRLGLGTLVAVSLGTACSGPGNTGKTVISDSLAEQIPWVIGRPPARDADGTLIIPTTAQFPPIHTGQPDLDPVPPPDCAAYERATVGVTFSTDSWYETFEPGQHGRPRPGPFTDTVGVAEAWAGHDDKSEGSWRTPGEFNAYSELKPQATVAWGIPAVNVPGPSCDGKPNDWVFRFQGGRYNRFGAGVEHPLALIDDINCPTDENGQPSVVCPTDAVKEASGIPDKPYAQTHYYWDVSSYDGISFWGRRGPEGQGAFTTVLLDKHTSSDLNKENNAFCERIKPCWSECKNHGPCSENPAEPGIFRCFDPADGDLDNLPDPSLLDEVAPRCGVSACTSATTYVDRDFDSEVDGVETGSACRPYTFDTHESGEFCFKEGEDPPDTGYRCGDGYAKEVTLTPYWKFYKIRFSELRQQGFGKVSPHMDLTTASSVAFLVAVGWSDFYLDNVSFYREAK